MKNIKLLILKGLQLIPIIITSWIVLLGMIWGIATLVGVI